MSDFTVEELVVPTSMDQLDAADFAASVGIMAATELEGYGHDELRMTPAEVLPIWQDAANPRRLLGVRIDGALVARAMYEVLLTDAATCWAMVNVLPPFRGRGIGTAIATHLEELALSQGRSKIISYAIAREADGERLEAPTGFGSLPLENAGVRFLLHRGYTLEQVVRGSRLTLPFEGVLPPVPADYRLHYWTGPVPPEWREDMVLMHTRMTTDAPTAALEEPEDVMTVERLLALEEAYASSPRTDLTAAVEHIPSGHLAGFTVLEVPAESHRAVHQDDTLVLKEHRGHRLGMVLKVANLLHLERVSPGHTSVLTFNAEENRFMLDTNEAVGFVPVGYEGAWMKNLSISPVS